MKSQHKRQLILLILSILVELCPFGAFGSAFSAEELSGFSFESRGCRAFSLRELNRIPGIGVEKRSPISSIPPWTKMILFALVRLIIIVRLNKPKTIPELKATDTNNKKAYGFTSPYNNTPLVEPTDGVRAGDIPEPKQSQTSPSSSKREKEPTVHKLLGAPQLNGVKTTLEGIPKFDGGIQAKMDLDKVLEYMLQPKKDFLGPIPAMVADIFAFQIVELVTETIGQSPSLVPIEPITDNARNRNHQTLTVLAPPTPSPINPGSPQTIVRDTMPSHRFHEQPITVEHAPEISSVISNPPATLQQHYVPVMHLAYQLQTRDASIEQLSRSIHTPPPNPMGHATNHGLGGSFEGVQPGGLDAEFPHTNRVVLNTINVVRDRAVTEARSVSGGFSQHTTTPTPPSGTPNTSPQPPPTYNPNQQSYRPRFQALNPSIERSVQAEQPWSPEHPATPEGQDKIKVVIDNFDALFHTHTES